MTKEISPGTRYTDYSRCRPSLALFLSRIEYNRCMVSTEANSAINQSEFQQLPVPFSKRGKHRSYKVRLVLVLFLIVEKLALDDKANH